MPCMSYDDRSDYSEREWKRKTDMLARIACRALQALEDMGKEDFLLLQDDEVRTWWAAHKEADRKAREAAEAKRVRNEAKKRALAKLSDEEKVLLGLKKK